MRRSSIFIAALLVASSCSVGPDYVAPESATKRFSTEHPQWSTIKDSLIGADSAHKNLCAYKTSKACEYLEEWDIEPWWTGFDDPALHEIMLEALNNNLELQQGIARVKAAAAVDQSSRSEFWPTVIPQFQYSESKASEANAPGIPASARQNAFYNVGAGVSWEIDIFGRLRRQHEYTYALYEAEKFSLHELVRATLGEIGRSYAQLRSLQMQKYLQDQIVKLEKKRLTLTKAFFEVGNITKSALVTTKAALHDEIALREDLKGQIAVLINKIHVLLGKEPGSLSILQGNQAPVEFSAQTALLQGAPTTLLQARPDVLKAEAELRAATASIGVAVADFYPRIDFEGNAGYSVVSLSDVGRSLAEVYTLVPRMRWVFYESTQVRAAINEAKANTQQTLLQFKLTVLNALEEASSGIHKVASTFHQLDQMKKKKQVWSRNYSQSKAESEVGTINKIGLIDAERQLLKARISTQQAQLQHNLALVDLVQAFGSGWQIKSMEEKA